MVNLKWSYDLSENGNMPPPDVEGWRRAIKKAIRSHRISLNYFSQISGIPLGNLSRFIEGKKLAKKYKRALGIDHRRLDEIPPDDLLWKLQHREEL